MDKQRYLSEEVMELDYEDIIKYLIPSPINLHKQLSWGVSYSDFH